MFTSTKYALSINEIVMRRSRLPRQPFRLFTSTQKTRIRTSQDDSKVKSISESENENENENENETIEGVWVFHRHGDRSPGRPLIADHMYEKESEFWRTKIPPTDRTYYQALSEKFPTSVHESNNNGKFLDADNGREPYGFLTWKGMDQMYNTGTKIAQRYRNTNHRHHGNDQFLNDWDLKGYSTNYLRTVMSVQCFMDGLLHSSPPERTDKETEHSYEKLSIKEFKAKRPPLFNTDETIIQVRDRNEDTLNAFDKRPEFMKKLVGDVVKTRDFIDKDAKAGCLAARLANFLPGLAKATSYGGPSGINWIHAADHFVCRSSHDVPFSKFSHSEDDPTSEQTMAAMSYGVISHLAWRFRTWYKYPPLLAAIAGPPLQEIEKQIQNTSSESNKSILNKKGDKKKKPFVVYSCHDVTILSLLYGIGADFLASKEDLIEAGFNPGNDERWRFWPKYASTLVFELVRVNDSDSDSDSSHFVRILLNEKEIRPFSILQNKKDVLSISDFTKLIEELMSNNIPDRNGNEINNDGERDMSNWTG